MTDYKHVRIALTPCSETATDLLAAFLADIGYDSFVPDDQGLSAYIPADRFDADALDDIFAGFPIDVRHETKVETVEGQDWNEVWEKNYFQPIVIGDECVVHSSFHTDIPQARYDIVIDPRMAFGTGHHATTSMMMEYLLSLPMEGKSVIDMGTGTGILAILASMKGASRCVGIEIDPDAADNARDHLDMNNTENVSIVTGDASALGALEAADVFMANINRNIILADICDYATALRPGGDMLLSGFYVEDIPMIETAARDFGLTPADYKTKDNWCALHLRKK